MVGLSAGDGAVYTLASHHDQAALAGNLLDDDDNGSPGGDYLRTFTVNTRGLDAAPTLLVIDEGGSAEVDLTLFESPATPVTVTVTRVSGSASLAVTGMTTRVFDAGNWNTPQAVPVFALKDVDMLDENARFEVSAPGWTPVAFEAAAIDNDRVIAVSTNDLVVLENTDGFFGLRLGGEPTAPMTVTVSRVSGNSSIAVLSPTTFVFDPANWSVEQSVRIFAYGDSDILDGVADIVASSPSLASALVTVREADDDRYMEVRPSNLSVQEGGVSNLELRLSANPGGFVYVQPSRMAGTTNLSLVSTNPLVFTSDNWSTWQPVAIQAGNDTDYTNATAVFAFSAPNWLTATATVTEIDLGPPDLVITTDSLPTETVGQAYFATLTANGGIPPYVWSLAGGSYVETQEPNSFSANAGQPLNFHGDDSWVAVALPFAFPFYGGSYTQCFVDTNARIRFDFGQSDYTESLAELEQGAMIAAMWDDLSTYSPDNVYTQHQGDVFMLRWDARYLSSSDVDFSIALHADGEIRLRYGPSNANGGLVGISSGDNSNYLVSALSQSGSLADAPDLVFRSTGGLPDGMTFSTNGMLGGVPDGSVSNEITVIVVDSVGASEAGTFSLVVLPDPAGTDTDEDGIPDDWELRNGLDPAVSNSPSANSDGDAFTDYEEYIADTNPKNTNSFFPEVVLTNPPTGTMMLMIDPTSTARVYKVEWSTNLSGIPQLWYLYPPEQTETGSTVTFTVTNDAPGRIYRTGVRLP